MLNDAQIPSPSLPGWAADVPEPPKAEVYLAPVSFGQRRLWLVDRLDPGKPTYNVPVALRVSGPLRPALLGAALTALTERHETLRTAFGVEDDEPVQLISSELASDFAVVDLGGLSAGQRAAEARRGLATEAERPFDLERAPLLRTTLFALGPDDYLLLLNLHHIVTDAWSLGILVRELLALYEAGSTGRTAVLPELAIQFADYAAWQREVLQGETLALKLRPWRRRLEGVPEVLELPADRSRADGGNHAGATVPFELTGPVLAALRDLARAGGSTLFMAALAGYQALLARWTGRHDLVVGAPVANRNRLETENVAGFFVNTLALRGDLGGDPCFRQLLARVREVVVEAFAHEDVPFELLVDELRPERRLHQNPLFQVALGFQQPTVPELAATGLVMRPLPLHSRTAKFDLSLQLTELPGRLTGFWELDTSRFDRATVLRLSGHLARLFEEAMAEPDRPLSTLRLLAPGERHQLLVEWNDIATAYPREATLPALFAEQAARTPDAPAVASLAGVLTYRDLDGRAAAVARRLRTLGVGLDDRVGVRLRRGPDLIVAFLGILQAGGAYVPLDPDYPEERLAFMAEDSGLRALLTAEDIAAALAMAGEDPDPAAPPPGLTADHLAYVIYTSGSTGRPKGVAVPHRAVVRLVRDTNYVDLTPADRVAQASNASFDAVTFEIWGTLLNGACLVILGREITLAPDTFARALREERITAMFLTTALFNLLANADPACFETVTHLLFGGEAVDPTRVAAVLAAGPPARLLHVYGPTESTTFATWQKLAEVPPGAWTLPIGRPLANTRAVLLDAGLQPVPIGAHGEVFLGGDGLARDYFGRPRLTAERFVPDPFGAGDRLYRTGDLARLCPDGTIEFLGRFDAQVKIRGFRIEPAEIEAVLGAHPAVAECVVMPRRGSEEVGLTLVAYVVRRPGTTATSRQLRDHLKTRLPDYMIPPLFIDVPALPRTPNGKVDRDALPEPGGRAETVSVAPRTPVEEVLAGLWASWLGAERIGAHDHFFDLGGNSLTATALTSQARTLFQVEIPARALFESPTLAGFAERIEELTANAAGLRLPPIVPAPDTPEAPLSFAQQRLWFVDEMSRGASPFYNIAAAIDLTGGLDTGAIAAAFSEIVRRHEVLRTSFRPGAGGLPVQVIHPPLSLPLPVIDLGDLPPEHREAESLELLRGDACLAFDLTTAPLLRTRLLRLDGERHLLSFVMHHIVSDGWSLGVFLRELARLYSAFAERRPSPVPELPVQYADFAFWQRQWLAGEALEPQLNYWRQKLAGAPLVLELPTDHPRPPGERFAGGSVAVALPEGAIERLQALSRAHRTTLFMTLLAAYSAFLSQLTGKRDMLIGTPNANRNRDEVTDLIGFFVNLLVLRADLAGDPAFTELLARVREMALGAYTHQDLPFERLVEDLRPARDVARNPLFQVSFSLDHQAWSALELPGLKVGFVEPGSRTELFDLSLRVTESRNGWDLRLGYNADLFEAATIARWAHQFEQMVVQVLDEPGRPVAGLAPLTEEERREVRAAAEYKALQMAALPADLEIRFPLHVYEHAVAELWADLLGLELRDVSPEANFFELGGHSMLLQVVRVRLQETFGVEIAILDLFNHPTAHSLGLHLRNLHAGVELAPGEAAAAVPAEAAEVEEETGEEIAVIGLSGRFPGARDMTELWHNLSDGIESISFFPDLAPDGAWPPPPGSASHRVRAGGAIAGPDLWDADFFGYSPREAELIDPQQRLFLEHAWQALEDAGYDAGRHAGPIGVFGGVGKSDYLLRVAAADLMSDPVTSQLASLGSDRDFVTTRVSYKLGLEGPSLNVQTACSTGLVAVHLACRSLLDGECDLALAGAASVTAFQSQGYVYREGGVLSPDGHCRPFDVGAAGSVDSDGVGVVVLKRLRDAVVDGDTIRAVIRASGINNDGGAKAGFTAPRVATQARLIRSVLERARLTADRIGFLEAHGTATPLGDPIEVQALIEAFRATTAKSGYCALGSIKSNFGHTNAAAGVAGLIKVVLALQHRQIPPSLHFERPNPAIPLDGSPFFVNTDLRPWEPRGGRRRAGVSSLGMGGTNVHAIVEEAPPAPTPEPPARTWQLLVLSARTPTALDEATQRLASHLARHPTLSLADVTFTLQNGRRTFQHRRAVLARDLDEAVAALEALDPEHTAAGLATRHGAPVAFLFPGQGAHEAGMAAGLYRDEPVFRAELDRATEAFRPHLDFDLREVLVSPSPGQTPPLAAGLSRTGIAQPALFAVEHALARTWMSWGVGPRALLGHSLGEYVAACLAGVFTLEDAATLVAVRGRLLQQLPPGAMLAVPLPPEEVEPLLTGELAVAAVNGPARTVVSGPAEAVAALEERLADRGAAGRRLATSHAFHSPMMKPVLPLFAAEVRKVRLAPPAIPYLSNLTGSWIRPVEATDPDYWVRHLRETVLFAPALAELLADPTLVLLEVGPGRTLSGTARQVLPGVPARQGSPLVALSSLPSTPDVPEAAFALLTLGRLWAAGVEVDWPALHGHTRRSRVPLPTYPFKRRRFWVDLPLEKERRSVQPAAELTVPPGPSFADPATLQAELPTVRQLAAIWRDLLHVEEVGPDSDFFTLGGDSLLAIGLAGQIRDGFRIEIPVRELLVRPRLAQLAAAVDEALARLPNALPRTLVPLQEGRPDRRPFFAIHPSGGNVVCYRPLVGRIDPDRPLYALQAPGLEGEQEPYVHIPALAAHHVETVRRIQPAGPYLLGGWSSGGMVAFEMARQLEQHGDSALVVLFDTFVPADGAAMDDLDLLLWKAGVLGVPLTRDDLAGHTELRTRLSALLARAVEGLPSAGATTRQRLLAVEISSLAGFFRYRPQPLAASTLVALRATGHHTRDGVPEETPFATVDVATAWRRFTSGPFIVHEVAADHATLLQEPWVGQVAAHLDRHLEASEVPEAVEGFVP